VNNDSLVLLVEWTGLRLLLTGDADLTEQDDLAADYDAALQADILKIPNHAKGPHSESFVDAVDAAYAVCSVGPNELGYPSQETLDDYATTSQVFVTEEDGAIQFLFNGEEIQVLTGQ
jgi:competence protein ComEC